MRQQRHYHESRLRGLEEAIKALSVRPPTPQAPQVLVQAQQQPSIPTPQFQPLVEAAEEAFEDSSRPFLPRDKNEAQTLVRILDIEDDTSKTSKFRRPVRLP